MSVFEFAKSTISRAIGSAAGPALPFSIGEPISSSPSSLWAIHRGTKKDDNTPVSVFVFDCARFKDKVAIARNCLKRFKTIRHPDILKFIDGVETDSQIIIGTEAVEPLSSQLAESSNENMTAWGLFKIGRAIKFLNTDCSIIHANVRIDSIFVTKAGEWKLGGLELLCSLKEERPFVVDYGNSLPDSSKYIPPEFRNGSWSMVKSIPVWAIDSWQYGCLLYEIFNQPFSRPEELAKKGAIPQSLALAYKGLLNSDPRSRMDIETVLERGDRQGGYFDNDFVKVSIFLEQIAMKDAHEKDQFLRKIDASIDTFPTDFCKYKILPELINALEFGGAGAKALTPILKIGSKMTHEEFDSLITPIIVRLFSSNDRSIRSSLCENLGHFVEHLSTKVVNDKIFPNLATGFGDTSALIRELTLKSILLIIGKLSERVINNDLLRYLAKLQTDEEPGIRTNTTICLGKISKHLSDSTRKKILIPAFTRSLHDPFPPSRNAGLLALAATQDYYDATDIALKVLPHMSPLLVDNERNIREQAFKAFDVFIKKLEAHSKSMPEPQAPAVSPAAQVPSATAPAATSNPAQAGPASSPADSWSSWSAVSVLSSKLTNTIIGSAGAPATPTPGSGIGAPPSAGPAGQARPVALDRAASASPQIRTNPPTQYGANNASASRPAASNGQSSSSKPTAGDGWNDDDTGGWDVDEEADYDDGWEKASGWSTGPAAPAKAAPSSSAASATRNKSSMDHSAVRSFGGHTAPSSAPGRTQTPSSVSSQAKPSTSGWDDWGDDDNNNNNNDDDDTGSRAPNTGRDSFDDWGAASSFPKTTGGLGASGFGATSSSSASSAVSSFGAHGSFGSTSPVPSSSKSVADRELEKEKRRQKMAEAREARKTQRASVKKL